MSSTTNNMQNDKAHIEAKGKLFSLYYGQKVFNDGNGEYLYPLTPDFLNKIHTQYYLVLRSVKQLTDFEANLIGFLSVENLIACLEAYGEMDFENNFIRREQHQILIGLGVIRPITMVVNGEVKTYEVEDVIKLGWVKVV